MSNIHNPHLIAKPRVGELSKEKLIQAIEINHIVQMTYLAEHLPQIELIKEPSITVVNSGLLDDSFNYVIAANFEEKLADGVIRKATDYFKQRQVPFSWWLNPYDRPTNLSEILVNYGYALADNNPGMYFDLDAWDDHELLASCPLTAVRVGDERTWRDFALISANDEEPSRQYLSWVSKVLTHEDPIEYYVGYVQGQPVVSALLCYAAGVAGLYWLVTSPQERRKGYGTLMQYFMFKRARELGYHVMILQSSEQGYSVYKKLGYKDCGLFREYKVKL